MSPKPVLSLRFISSSDLDGSCKETDVQLSLYNTTSFVTADFEWIADLAAFAKTPEGVCSPPLVLSLSRSSLTYLNSSLRIQAFEDVVPSEVTRISLKLEDTSIHVAAPTHPGALVLSLGTLAISTELISDATGKTVDLSGKGIRMFLIDDLKAPLPEKGQSHRPLTGPEYWKVNDSPDCLPSLGPRLIVPCLSFDQQRGYASLAEISTVALVLHSDPEEDPKTEVSWLLSLSQIPSPTR